MRVTGLPLLRSHTCCFPCLPSFPSQSSVVHRPVLRGNLLTPTQRQAQPVRDLGRVDACQASAQRTLERRGTAGGLKVAQVCHLPVFILAPLPLQLQHGPALISHKQQFGRCTSESTVPTCACVHKHKRLTVPSLDYFFLFSVWFVLIQGPMPILKQRERSVSVKTFSVQPSLRLSVARSESRNWHRHSGDWEKTP